MTKDYSPERRAFFRTALRSVALGTLLLGIGIPMARKRGETCTNQGVCKHCSALRDCGLPRALSVKQAKAQH